MRTSSHVALLLGLAFLAPLAAAQPLPGLDEAHAAGRLGRGATVAIVSAGAAPLAATVREVAPDAVVLAFAPDASLADVAGDVVLLDLPRDASPAGLATLAARAMVVVPTGDDALRHWGGIWRDADGDALLDFAVGDDALAVDLRAGVPFEASLSWRSDAPADDYDLFLYDADLKTPLAWSNAYQADGSPPAERIQHTPTADGRGQLVVRAYATTSPARLDLLAPLLEHAVADGSALPLSLAADVLSVGASSSPPSTDLLPTTGRAGDAPLLRAPGGTSLDAAARIAGLAALIAAERPDLGPAARAAILGVGAADAFDALARADTTPAAAVGATPSVAGAVRGGDVAVTLQFDDALAAPGDATLVLADGARVPLAVVLDGRTVARAEGAFPSLAADGPVAVETSGFRDWSGHGVSPATFPLDLVLDATPPVVGWSPLPALASAPFTFAWTATDATSGVVSVQLEALEDGAWRLAQPSLPPAGSLTWSALVDGALRLRLTARDAAGNTVTSFSESVQIDTTPPSIVAADSDDPLRIAVGDEGAGLDTATVAVTLDGAPVDHAFDADGLRAAPASDLVPGYHELVVTATDVAGNAVTTTLGFSIPGPDLDLVYPPASPETASGGASVAAPALPPPVGHGARETRVPESPTTDDAGERATTYRMLEPPIPEPPVRAASALAPTYAWQPPAMVLFFAVLAALVLYWRRKAIAEFGRGARIFFANEWARILRAKWRLSEARWPRRMMLRWHAFVVRMRWRRARRV